MSNEPLKEKKIFIDMDGTLAKFYEKEGCVECFRRKNFFLNLLPYPDMLKAVAILMDRGVDVTILSAVPIDSFGPAVEEKKQWLCKHFGELGKTPPPAAYVAGQSKSDFVRETCGTLKGTFLLDDFSVNLADFVRNGGSGIKAYNEVNGQGWSGINWNGAGVDCSDMPENIADNICRIMGISAT